MTRIIAILFVSMAACGGKGDETPTAPAAAADAGAATPEAKSWPPIVAAYEALRDRLADDDLAGAKTAAAALDKVALAEGAAAEAIAAGAQALIAAGDVDAARLAFGKASQAYLTLLAARADLSAGLVAFRCPMAAGYQKWVQVDDKMKNPYMGKAMLECGSKVALAP